MKKFLITEQQIQAIATILLEMQAKLSLNAIDILRNLPLAESQEENKKDDN